MHLDFIRPGRPVENGYIESFNGKLRDEFLPAVRVVDGLALVVVLLREQCLRPAETLRPDHTAAGIGISLRIRTRLYAAAAKVDIHPTFNSPQCLSLRSNAISLIQPKHYSILFLFF